MFNLTDKTTIITGGAGLIGSAFSRECAKYSANVLVVFIFVIRCFKIYYWTKYRGRWGMEDGV